jgi:hypothetical protein
VRAPGFSLVKWYLDVVGDDGRAVIAYAARLRLGPLRLDYASVLDARPRRPARTRASLRTFQPPRRDGDGLAFRCAPLALAVRLEPLDPPFEETLHAEPGGAVRWRVLAPRARVTLSLGAEEVRGLGYAERLDLDLPPWRLPIAELRWGRALAEGGGVVWVDWRGPRPVRRVLAGGRPVTAAEVLDGRVAAGGADLVRLGEGRVLREGRLGATVARALPASLRRRLPALALGLDEVKWCAPAVIAGAGAGTAIHEVVRWP